MVVLLAVYYAWFVGLLVCWFAGLIVVMFSLLLLVSGGAYCWLRFMCFAVCVLVCGFFRWFGFGGLGCLVYLWFAFGFTGECVAVCVGLVF